MTMFIIVLLCVPYVIDISINGQNLYKRYKIGRWKSIHEWENAVVKIAKKWIIKTPTVRKKDNSRFIILDIMTKNYKNSTIQSWQKGLVYLAIAEREKKDLSSNFVQNGEWINMPTDVDYSLLAYAILKNAENKITVKPAMDKMYNLLLSCYQESDGCLYYRKIAPNHRYVDTVGFAAPFLSYYGQVYNIENAKKIAVHIVKEFYAKGFHKDTLLPVHAYDIETNAPLGIYGWGRGTGWFLLGLVETYENSNDKQLLHIIYKLAETYIHYQRKDGAFNCIIQAGNMPDSSATAVFAYFFAYVTIKLNQTNYYKNTISALNYLMSVTRRNGEIDFSQGDTKGVGFYSNYFDIMPFTQGMVCKALYCLKGKCCFDE